MFRLNDVDFGSKSKKKPSSLTLEGQIVAIADEIAQRAADLGDAKVKARYLENIEGKFRSYLKGRDYRIEDSKNPYYRLEWIIFTTMTEDVVENSFENLKKLKPIEVKFKGVVHAAYTKKVVAFTPDVKNDDGELVEQRMEGINENLEDFVTAYSAQSEEVRESDSRAKYIIRQLYKAYINDVTLLPDVFIEDHLRSITKTNGHRFEDVWFRLNAVRATASQAVIDAEKAVQNAEKTCLELENQLKNAEIALKAAEERVNAFAEIRDKKWHVDSDLTRIVSKKGTKILRMGAIKDYFGVLKTNNEHGKKYAGDPNVAWLFDAFVLDVGFYIAGMTNTEAFDAYNKIYGHTL